jgi:hypothetical protein
MAMALFALVSSSLIGVITSATASDSLARQRTIALELAQQQVEYIRQLNYTDAGTQSGNPPGAVLASQSKQVMGLWYTLDTRIAYVDDAIPTSFETYANYKRIRIVVSRATDGKELARVTTYLSSATRAPFGGINNAIVNVTVQDVALAVPLPGAVVHLWDGPSPHASDTTNETGLVTFPALTANPETGSQSYYDLLATLSGYQQLKEDTPPGTVPSGTGTGPANAGHVQLDASQTVNTTIRLYRPCSISVEIKDESTGLPYLGAVTVTISSARGSEAFTTTNGYLSLDDTDTLAGEPIVPGLNYTVEVDTAGHRHGELTDSVPDDYLNGDRSTNFVVTLRAAVPPHLSTVTVHVRRIRSSTASCWNSTEYISAATVTINDPAIPYTQTLTTNSNGQAVFSSVQYYEPNGTYDISAKKYISNRWREGALDDQPVDGATEAFCVPILY